jgi:TM2 domain-containing membrane protein YozV
MGFVLWIVAVVLVIVGIVQLFQGQIILGIVLIVLGFLVGPGGFSIFRTRTSRRSRGSSDDFWR